MKTICPGQDTRYWRPDDIFTAVCLTCGNEMEFFKDDAKRRCKKCGTIVQNPRLSRGCAQWCRHAKDCLGYDPSETSAGENDTERSIAGRIIDSIRREFGPDNEVLDEAIRAADRADAIMKSLPANPRVTIPAILLLMVDGNNAGGRGTAPAEENRFPVSEKILGASGADRNDIDEILGILRAYHSGIPADTPEYRAVAASRLNS